MWNDLLFYGIEKPDRSNIPQEYHQFLLENVRKTKISHPYGYDPFLVFFNEEAKKQAQDTIYTDRLYQWDYAKHDELCKKHFGNVSQYWDTRSPKKIEAFLSDWTGKKVVLIANIQYVNLSSGYPVWRLDFYVEE